MSSFIQDHTKTVTVHETIDVLIEKLTVHHEQFDWTCKVCQTRGTEASPEKAAAAYSDHSLSQHSVPRHEVRIKIEDPIKMVYFADEGTFNAFTNVGNTQRQSKQSEYEKKSVYYWAGAAWYVEDYRERTPEETAECDGDDYGFGYITASVYVSKIYAQLNKLIRVAESIP